MIQDSQEAEALQRTMAAVARTVGETVQLPVSRFSFPIHPPDQATGLIPNLIRDRHRAPERL